MSVSVERPILFSGPMVRAGEKTQTRRIVKAAPGKQSRWLTPEALSRITAIVPPVPGAIRTDGTEIGLKYHSLKAPDGGDPIGGHVGVVWCPYGEPGDRLWVRERMRVVEIEERVGTRPHEDRTDRHVRLLYEADGTISGWLPHPPRLAAPVVGRCLAYGGNREASRITLEVLSVRGERLQSITDDDIRAEGVTLNVAAELSGGRPHPLVRTGLTLRDAWTIGWDAINGKRANWASNPWVWVVGFKRVEV